jgi:hypothetical protein
VRNSSPEIGGGGHLDTPAAALDRDHLTEGPLERKTILRPRPRIAACVRRPKIEIKEEDKKKNGARNLERRTHIAAEVLYFQINLNVVLVE